MASQSADPGGDRNRDRPPRPPVSSLHGKAHWHHSTRNISITCSDGRDLENKLLDFGTYFNHHRTHHSREGRTPGMPVSPPVATLHSFRWRPHCRGLYQTSMAA